MEQKEYTTIQIYREDLEFITNLCKKNENLRDKLHEIIFHISSKEDENNKQTKNPVEEV